jgi:putative oxidoreductase
MFAGHCVRLARPISYRSVGSYSVAPDRWLWFHGAWFRQLSKGPDALAAILHALAVPAPHFMAWITILIELLGGLAILLGALVSLVSLPMAALLLVAIFSVRYGFSSIKLMAVTATGAQFGPPGYECDLLYLACLAALVLGGSGPLAIDGLLRKNRRTLKHKRPHDWSAS